MTAWTLMGINTFICGSLAMILGVVALVPGLRWIQNFIHRIAIVWAKIGLFLTGTTVQVENKDKIYRQGPIIIIGNHQSLFDILLYYKVCDRVQFRWMAKDTLFKIPIFGWGMAGAGYIPVNRKDRKKSMVSLYKGADKIKEGASVLVFPEGTRSTDPKGEMLKFKKGAFTLAKKAEVVIQPITIWGASTIIPKQTQFFMQRIYPGKTQAVVHDPISPSEYEKLTSDQLAEKLRVIIAGPMERLNRDHPLE